MKELAGTASGLTGTVQISTGIVLTVVVSLVLAESAVPLFALISGSALVCAGGLLVLRNQSKKKSNV